MNEPPKHPLYSEALCIGDRPEIAPIADKRVWILACSKEEDGTWRYSVALGKTSPVFICFESELEHVEPIPLIPDEQYIANIVAQTAILRYSVRSEGLRNLLCERGHDPQACLQLSSGQGFDVNIDLVLPDGTFVNTDYREHPETRQAVEFSHWSICSEYSESDRESDLAREIVTGADTSQFDAEARRYYRDHIEETDAPLPPQDE